MTYRTILALILASFTAFVASPARAENSASRSVAPRATWATVAPLAALEPVYPTASPPATSPYLGEIAVNLSAEVIAADAFLVADRAESYLTLEPGASVEKPPVPTCVTRVRFPIGRGTVVAEFSVPGSSATTPTPLANVERELTATLLITEPVSSAQTDCTGMLARVRVPSQVMLEIRDLAESSILVELPRAARATHAEIRLPILPLDVALTYDSGCSGPEAFRIAGFRWPALPEPVVGSLKGSLLVFRAPYANPALAQLHRGELEFFSQAP